MSKAPITVAAAAFCAVALTAGAQGKPIRTPPPAARPAAKAVMPKHKIGDRVQVYYEKWYPATIREVGKGDYAGFYRVAFNDFQRERWVDDDEVKAIPSGTHHPGAFLSGDYKCYRRSRPSKPQLVDELYLKPNGDYSMKDNKDKGFYMLGDDNKIILQGGGLDDADAHVDGVGQLHVTSSRHTHWGDDEAKQLYCVLKYEAK